MKLRFMFFLGIANFLKKGSISRYLKGSIVGIGLSLIPLIVVLEVTDGMIEGITSRYLEIGTYHMEIFFNNYRNLKELETLGNRIDGIKGVKETIIEKRGTALISAHGLRTAVVLRAIPNDLYKRDQGYKKYMRIISGEFGFHNESSILISKAIADKLKLKVGDKIPLVTIGESAFSDSYPKFGVFTVTGIFSTGYQEMDKLLVFISLKKGMKYITASGSSQIIGVKVDNPFKDLSVIANNIEKVLPKGTAIYSWYELEIGQYKSFRTTKAMLVLIMALIVIIASINISSSMIMIVIEKSREIAILKSIGAYPWMITGAFLLTGFAAGFAGTVLGLASGILISVNINEIFVYLQGFFNIISAGISYVLQPITGQSRLSGFEIFNSAYYLDRIPIRLNITELSLVSFGTILLSALASYFPAKKAGLLKPLKLLRRY